ncbi:MAG: hypothetical protein ACNI3C_04590 [Candidatus Marinarcus sp.]|uniref:hypothetical protein n=1 Tax=Candidatus Marinarcus sp. TaxID=3100987 RepID=UPI003B0057F0
MLKIVSILIFMMLLLNAKELTDPAVIFQKKCQMCHALNSPSNDAELKSMAAPYMPLAMKSVVTGIDAIEEPKNNQELKTLTVAHIKDYIFNPSAEKSFCEDIIFEKFRYMPPLGRFISKEEATIVAPWVYDNFAPIKYKVD